MSLIEVKCPNCIGTGRKDNRGCSCDGCERCERCRGLGKVLVREDEARSILLQKQIKDAKL